jgi:hypothetical protein
MYFFGSVKLKKNLKYIFDILNEIDDIYNVLKKSNLNNYHLLYFLQIFKVWFVRT